MAKQTLSINVELLTAQAVKNGKNLAKELDDLTGISTKKVLGGVFDNGFLSKEGMKDFRKELKSSRDILSDIGLDNVVKSAKMANDGFQNVDKMLGKTAKGYKTALTFMDRMNFSFSMNFLGTLFFGQALKRLSDQIMGSTLPLFMKLTEGQTESGMAMTALSATWETLKFAMGSAIAEALLPFIPTMINIIGLITDFIDKHPNIGLSVIALAGIGTALSAGSQTFLALSSISNIFWGPQGLLKGVGLAQTEILALGAIKLGISFFIAKEAFDEFSQENLLSGLADVAILGGIFSTSPKGQKWALVATIGFNLASVLTGEKKFDASLRELGKNIALMGFLTGNIYLIGIGISLVLLPEFFDAVDKVFGIFRAISRAMGALFLGETGAQIRDLEREININRNLQIPESITGAPAFGPQFPGSGDIITSNQTIQITVLANDPQELARQLQNVSNRYGDNGLFAPISGGG